MSKLPYVAIVGQTNVGKSSIFNRLYGSQEAIVAREAGTTRDNVVRKITIATDSLPGDLTSGKLVTASGAGASQATDSISRDSAFPAERGKTNQQLAPSESNGSEFIRLGISDDGSVKNQTSERNHHSAFWLVDTAGLKPAEDEFEASIQEQIEEATELADVILVVVDSTLYPSDQDRRIAKTALKSKKPVILLANKSDLKGSLPEEEFRRLGIKTILHTSAEHARGMQKLMRLIAEHLPKTTPAANDDARLKIALIGRPNVGKSYLFNTLAGKQQALVANIAGTTRDVNRVTVKYKGQNIELLDTAGIRRSGKQEQGIEKFSVLRTLAAIDEADVCLLLMDVNELNTQLDQKLAGLIKEAGKGLVLVVTKWDIAEDRDAYTRDDLAPRIAHEFAFVPWAPLIFTSAVTGQNVAKLFEIASEIHLRRQQQFKTTQLNKILQECVAKHPPAGLKNTYPKLRYMVQTDVSPPWFVVFGSNLKLLHWSYKRYLEKQIRQQFDLVAFFIRRRWLDLGIADSGGLARQDGFDIDLRAAAVDVAEAVCRRVGKINHPVGQERAAIIDPHDHALAATDAGYPDVGRQRQRRVRGGHGEHVVGLADRGFLTMEFPAVPAGDAPLAEGAQTCFRYVGFAEHGVRTIGEAVQGLRLRNGIGNLVQIIGNLVSRPVILVVTTAAFLSDSRLACCRRTGHDRSAIFNRGHLAATGSQ